MASTWGVLLASSIALAACSDEHLAPVPVEQAGAGGASAASSAASTGGGAPAFCDQQPGCEGSGDSTRFAGLVGPLAHDGDYVYGMAPGDCGSAASSPRLVGVAKSCSHSRNTGKLPACASIGGMVASGDVVYFTEGHHVVAQPVTCGEAATVLSDSEANARGIALEGGFLYWADGFAGAIVRMPVTGGAREVLAIGQQEPTAVAVDAAHVYWTNTAASGAVLRVPIAGGPLESIVEGLAAPISVALDATHVYWANRDDGTIGRIAKTGGMPAVLLATGPTPARALTLHAGRIYWAAGGETAPDDEIRTVADDGGPTTVLAAGLTRPSSLVVDGAQAFFVAAGDLHLSTMADNDAATP